VVVEDDRVAGEAVEARRPDPPIPVRAEVVAAEGVADDEDEVAPVALPNLRFPSLE